MQVNVKGYKKKKLMNQKLKRVAEDLEMEFPGAKVLIFLHPESKKQGTFSLSMILRAFHREIILTRVGNHFGAVVNSLKNELIKKVYKVRHRTFDKRQVIEA